MTSRARRMSVLARAEEQAFRTDAALGSLEFFLWSGSLSLDDGSTEHQEVGGSGYIHVPQLCGGGELFSRKGALALALWNPNLPCFPYPYTRNRTIKPHAETWVNSVPGGHGVMHKSLRKPDPVPHPTDEGFDGGPGGYFRFQYIEPGMVAPKEHVHHECFEEIILLQGDCFLLNEGQMGIGSVVVRDSTMQKGPQAENRSAMIMIGAEGVSQPTREITIENNTAINTGDYETFMVVNLTATEAMLKGNRLTGPVKPLRGDGEVR